MSTGTKQRSVEAVVPADAPARGRRASRCAGRSRRRRSPQVDPFLLLDHMGPVDLGPGEAKGAPDHPHRGFETVTYMLDGAMEHEDSAGHAGRIGPGDVQWMTAGSGVIHSEMPAEDIRRDGGRLHGFQVWVNLPAKDKMIEAALPGVHRRPDPRGRASTTASRVRVIAGKVDGVQRRGRDAHAGDVPARHRCRRARASSRRVPASQNAMVVRHQRRRAKASSSVFAHDGDDGRGRERRTRREPRELLLLAGEPLREPVARYGPFVMTTKAEIGEADRRLPGRPLRRHRAVARAPRLRSARHGGADDDGAGRGVAVPGGAALARRAARGSRTSTTAGCSRSTSTATVETIVEVPECPSGLGWLPDGRMLVVSMHDRKLLRLDPGRAHRGRRPRRRSRPGTATTWSSTPRAAPTSATSASTSTAAATPVADRDRCGSIPTARCASRPTSIRFPNGTVITPDGATLIVGESYGGCLTAFDVDGRRRALEPAASGRSSHGAVPDGICLDAEGAIWSACPLTGRVLRVLEGGEVTDEVHVSRNGRVRVHARRRRPARRCSSAPPTRATPPQTGDRRGAIETCAVDVPGAGLP